ncbi:MAG TPA: metalloregulator ArsR/SmtB family transcription factor [Mycobacterium sp.]|nr:metalloregulator ArsR/SmtB family transcription factor [Mycobacterium sp.]
MSAQVVREPSDPEISAAAGLFKLLSDPTRLRIIWALLHGEHSVNELASHVGAQPPAVSQHLSKLRLAGVVNTRRDGNRILYGSANEHVLALTVEALRHADHVVGGAVHHRKEQAS